MTTPDEPTGTRLRARARVGAPRLRAEVADAVTGVERSLVDVATWERLQALEDATPRFSDSAGPEAAPAEVEVAPADAPVVDELDDPGVDDDVEQVSDEVEIPLLAAPTLLHRFEDEPAPVEELPESVLAAARPVPPAPPPVIDPEMVEAERQRRKGKILSWTGVALLLVVAAIWLIPDRGSGGDDPVTDPTTSTSGARLLPDGASTTSTVADTTTTEVTVPATSETTPTTAKRRASGSTGTTTPTVPPTATTHATTTTLPPLENPGPSRTVPTTPTPTTQPTTTTTQPPAPITVP